MRNVAVRDAAIATAALIALILIGSGFGAHLDHALLGYLGNTGPAAVDVALDASTQRTLVDQHRAAAVLIGQKKYTAGIRAL